MNKIIGAVLLTTLTACTSLTYGEKQELSKLKYMGVTVDTPAGNWERPASPVAAGMLNLLPGGGNFYLASGNGGQSEQYTFAFLNLLTWPISVIWGIPEAAIDAGTINKREMVMYYKYNLEGQRALAELSRRPQYSLNNAQ